MLSQLRKMQGWSENRLVVLAEQLGLAIETGSTAGPGYLSKDCLFSMAITSTR